MSTTLEEPTAFGSGTPFTVGVEEELFLVDPLTGRQANASAAVLDRLDLEGIRGRVEPELHACHVELITDICHNAGESVAQLGELRRAVLATGAGLLGSGTHPAALENEAAITDRERYEVIHDLLGDAVATPVGGLHIHVGMPDAEAAIRAFNGMRRHLPLLQALAANSPYRHGRDTGLASAREVTVRGWPRSGVPRAMRDYADFETVASRLARAADVPDYTWFWWKLRPHPRLGTVEVRALDAQGPLEDIACLVALAHCLARHEAEAEPVGDTPVEILEESIFRAARYGTQAQLPDEDGHLRPVWKVLEDALVFARRHAAELGCEAELERLQELLARDGGAARQRGIYAINGMDGLLRELTRATAAV
jgi:carboxylate-amine ligase